VSAKMDVRLWLSTSTRGLRDHRILNFGPPDDASQGTYAELRAFLGERGGSEEYRSSDPGVSQTERARVVPRTGSTAKESMPCDSPSW
jgi:hypothetical protein